MAKCGLDLHAYRIVRLVQPPASVPIRTPSEPVRPDDHQQGAGTGDSLPDDLHEVDTWPDPVDVQEDSGLPEVIGQTVVEPAGEVVGFLTAVADEDPGRVVHRQPPAVATSYIDACVATCH